MTRYGSLYCRLLAVGLVIIVCSLAVAEPLPGGMAKWMSPSHAFIERGSPGDPPVIGKPTRDPETGVYHKIDKGAAPDQRATWFGVADGKLRLQTSSIQQHLTVVGGDPQWTDYQVDVDLINRASRIRDAPVKWWNYLKFGLYGRVHVPQFPETRGGHSFVATEIGDYANEGYTADIAFRFRMITVPPATIPQWQSSGTRGAIGSLHKRSPGVCHPRD